MFNWTFYPVFAGTLVSIVGLTHFAVTYHIPAASRTFISELAAAEAALLKRLSGILLFCDALFAITLFGFIAPRIHYSALAALFSTLTIGGVLLVAVVPARGRTKAIHLALARAMSLGMIGLGAVFWAGLTGVFVPLEAALTIAMCILAPLILTEQKPLLVFELAFVFASHFSIVVAAIALALLPA